MKLFSSISKSIGMQEKAYAMPTAIDKRIRAIDQFRGFALFCLMLINFAVSAESVPYWLKHASGTGLYFADLGAPAFLFAIGLTYGLSFNRRANKYGLSAAYGQFARRYLAFVGMGAVISAGATFLGQNTTGIDWGVLQAIGCAGLLTLLVIRMRPGLRLAVGLGLLAGYQILLDTFWLETVLRSPHAGLAGSLSWSAVLILSTVLGDLFHDQAARRYFPLVSVLFVAAGFALGHVVPVSKSQVSSSYVLLTLGISGVIFCEFYMTNFTLNLFTAWGKNPILLYSLSFLLIGIFTLPENPAWHVQAPLWLVGIQGAALLIIMSSLAYYLQKRKFIFSL